MKHNTTAIAMAAVLLVPAAARASVSANFGWASDYFHRGILQAPSSASAGLDFEQGGFHAGTWAADVNDGLEVDAYFGYAAEISDLGYSVGFTGYYYTGDFDDTYREINLGAGFGWLALDVAVGEYDNFAGPTQDYTFWSLTLENRGFYAKVAGFTRDFAGEYVELGYGASVAEFDFGIAAMFANSDLVGEASESLVFTIGTSFDID